MRYLALDGPNFTDLFKNAPNLLEQIQSEHTDDSSVSIAHLYQPSNDPEKLSFPDVWPFISQNRSIHLEDVDMNCETDATNEILYSEGETITLIDLGSHLTAAILSSYEMVEELDITRCSLDKVACIMYSENLRLHSIDDAKNLRRLLPEWYGYSLTIDSCPGFDDRVLNAMGSQEVPSDMAKLLIMNSFNFSTAALRQMVEMRIARKWSTAELIDVIEGRNVPPMSKEDRDWFKANDIKLTWCEGGQP